MSFLIKAVGWIAVLAWLVHAIAQYAEPDKATAPVVANRTAATTTDVPDVPDFTLPPAVGNSTEGTSTAESVETVIDDCFFVVSPRLKTLIDKIKGCDIKHGVRKHDSSVLSIIPALGYKNGAAGVFKKYRLHINQNMEVACDDRTLYNADPQPGCLITIYVSRIRASGKYSELAGWHTSWFRGVNDKAFRPITEFAKHISEGDAQFLEFGGFVDIADRP